MELRFKKGFIKSYRGLKPVDQARVDAALDLFQQDPLHTSLRNHELKGKLMGLRSISAGHDLRIIFQEHDGYQVVILLKTGSHNQVY